MKAMLRNLLLGCSVFLMLLAPVTTAQAAIDPSSFAAHVQFGVGQSPFGVTIGDVDGDGLADIIVANRDIATVSVLRNISSGGSIAFAPQVQFAVGGMPWKAVIVDLDGDGRRDLAVVNEGGSVSALRNTGSSGTIAFAPQVQFGVGSGSIFIASGDLDGDGRPDLATADFYNGTTSVLRNTSTPGTIAFAGPSMYGVGSYPRSVAIGDLDGDGRLDLAVANASSYSVSVLRNTGSSGTIAFASQWQFPIGGEAFSVALSDMDGDTRLDMAVANLGGVIVLFRNTSTSGTINSSSFAPYTLTGGVQSPWSLTTGDLDGDAKPDLLASNLGTNNVQVLRNTSSSGSITFAVTLPFATGSQNYYSTLGDLNGDGKPELVAANTYSNSVSVLRNLIVLDTTPPETTITGQPANPSNDPNPVFSFTSNEPGSTFMCQIDGGGYAACTSPRAYGLGQTTHTFRVYAIDPAGNPDPTPAEYTWVIDVTPPDTSILSSPLTLDNRRTATFSFSSPDSGATFECSLDGTAYAACPNPQSYFNLLDGSHTFGVRARDLAGNNDPSPAEFAWVIDATGPDTSITDQPPSITASTTASFSFTSPETPVTFECSLDGSAYALCTSPQEYTGLLPGPHTFAVRGVDALNNRDASPATYNWTVDPAPVCQDMDVTIDEDTSILVTPDCTDIGGTPLTYEVVFVNGGTTALESGSIRFTPTLNQEFGAVFRYTANDGTSTSAEQSVFIHINSINDLPVAYDVTIDVPEDVPTWIPLNAADVDEYSRLSWFYSDPIHGSFTNPWQRDFIQYLSAENFNGQDSFTYWVNDGLGDSNIATVTVNVTPVNDAPTAADQSLSTAEDTALPLTLGAGDVDGDPLTWAVGDPAHGVLSGTAPDLTYTPDANYNGPDSFTFSVNDGTVDSNTATVTIDVTPVNDAPVVSDLVVSTSEDISLDLVLPATDVDGDPLTWYTPFFPLHGMWTGTAPNLTYTPDANYNGPDSFPFLVTDGFVDSNVAVVTITVTPVNDAPTASDQSLSTAEDTALPLTLGAADIDGDPLTWAVGDPAHGVLSGTAPDLTYAPDANYNGPDSFTFTVNDGTVDSNTATVTIDVTPVNDEPVAYDQSVSTPEDTAVPITLTALDQDGDPLEWYVPFSPLHGTLTGTAPDLVYTPDTDYNGPDSFTYFLNDPTSASYLATITIDVTPVNDAPVCQDRIIVVGEDSFNGTDALCSDVDGDDLTYSIVDQPANGLAEQAHGWLYYYPAADFNGLDSFTYRANDGGLDSNTAAVGVEVNPVNDAPVANNQSVNTAEDTALDITFTGSDVDGDTLVWYFTDPAHGILSGTPPNLTYTPHPNYYGPDSFTYGAFDGTVDSNTATVTIDVAPVNDAPVCQDLAIVTSEGMINVANIQCSDVEDDLLDYSIVDQPAHGTAWIDLGQVVYNPGPNYNGPDSFTYSANDGLLDSLPATVSVQVDPVNDIPVAYDQLYEHPEDTIFQITLGAGDVDGDPLTWTVGTPSHGTLSGTAPDLTYTPEANYNGPDSFTYFVNDGTVDSNIATVSINLLPFNDAPVADDQLLGTPEDTALPITLTAADMENEPLTWTVGDPEHGVLTGTAPDLVYTPDQDYNGPDSFNFVAGDGTNNSNTAYIAITVTPVNDAPVCLDVNLNTDEDTLGTTAPNCSDIDGDPLTYSIAVQSTHGTASVALDQLQYMPELNYNGLDSFTYTANDATVDSTPATVSVSVGSANDLPTAANDTADVNEDSSVSIDVLANDCDVEDDTLTVTDAISPAHGAVVINPDNTITYTPEPNYNGPDSFTYMISDGQGGTATALVTVTVAPVNDAPVASEDVYTARFMTTLTVTLDGVLENDEDVDGDALTVTLVADAAHGTLTLNPDGSFTYTPDYGFTGVDSFTYTASDGTAVSGETKVTINIQTFFTYLPLIMKVEYRPW